MLRDQEPEPHDQSGQFFEIRSWSAAATAAAAATGASAMAVHGSNRPPGFQKAVTILLLDIRDPDVPNEDKRKPERLGTSAAVCAARRRACLVAVSRSDADTHG